MGRKLRSPTLLILLAIFAQRPLQALAPLRVTSHDHAIMQLPSGRSVLTGRRSELSCSSRFRSVVRGQAARPETDHAPLDVHEAEAVGNRVLIEHHLREDLQPHV